MSVQIIDYLERRETFIIDSLREQLTVAANSGIPPDTFKLNGNAPELRDKRITDDYVDIILSPMRNRSFLRILDLSFNRITNRGIGSIAKWLIEDNSLHWLNVSSNDISAEGAKILAEALLVNSSLKVLDISNNHIEDAIGFASMLQINTSLTSLNLSGTDLSHGSFIALSTALERNTTLECLDLSNNKLVSFSSKLSLHYSIHQHLARMVSLNKGLTKIALNRVGLDDHIIILVIGFLYGGLALVEMLKQNDTLEKLYLGDTALTDRSIIALSDALEKHNTKLMIITLWGNEFTKAGCQSFSRLFEKNITVPSIDQNTPPRIRCRIQRDHTDVTFYTADGKMHVARNEGFNNNFTRT
ncbi:hypothetical protein BKA69DRAFT_1134280 [Paraphysoderma sedebokerense]|nr:hypothetical protein BKA69DRAFT_1134280 [Paraphysoderma sedebokerense]